MFKVPPVELWERLAALDKRCNLSLWRQTQWKSIGANGLEVWSIIGEPPAESRRVWRARLMEPGPGYGGIVDAAEPHLADALAVLLAEAERRGWLRPSSERPNR